MHLPRPNELGYGVGGLIGVVHTQAVLTPQLERKKRHPGVDSSSVLRRDGRCAFKLRLLRRHGRRPLQGRPPIRHLASGRDSAAPDPRDPSSAPSRSGRG